MQKVMQRQMRVFGTGARRSGHKSLIVRALSARSTQGRLELCGRSWACALGRGGRHPLKREGDGRTPAGHFQLRHVLYRTDAGLPPPSGLQVRPIRRSDGWCDAIGDRNYNRRVRHPYKASAEHLWRPDHLYDVVVVLGCNDRPRIQGRGSAIFMHLAHSNYKPTAGCIALSRRDLGRVLALCMHGTKLIVLA